MPEITQKIGEMTGDQFLLILRSILEPRLADARNSIGDVNAKTILLEARLTATETRLAQIEARLAAR